MKTFLAHFDKKNISNLVQHYGLEGHHRCQNLTIIKYTCK